MSLPLSRRIVQAALVVAAGAVPSVVAGTAQAAPALPSVPDLGGLSRLSSPDLGGTVENTAHQTGALAGSGAGQAVSNGLPVVADAAGSAAGQAVPVANRSMGSSAMQLVGVVEQAVNVAHGAGATRAMPAAGDTAAVAPVAAPAPAAAQLPASPPNQGSPLSSLPLSSLPVNSLPLGAAQGALGGALPRSAAAPAQRLGGLPSLGGAGQSPLSSVTGAVPGLSGLPIDGLPVGGLL
jgi:hypothetical protein